MKRLIIVRHGKSDWDHEGLADIDRPLKERGVNNSYKMAERLNSQKIIPDVLISSPANRALHTAIIFARKMSIPAEKIIIKEMLYFSSERDHLKLVQNIDNNISTVMIFGHNPTFTNFANKFIKNYIDNVPTSGVVILDFDIESWKDVNKTNLQSEYFDYPKKE